METNKTARFTATVSVASSMAMLALSFVVGPVLRPLILGTLGIQALGFYSLLQEILSQFSTLPGIISTTATFYLFEARAKKNWQRLKNLNALFKRAFFVIGITLLLITFIFLSNLHFLLKDETTIENANILFFLYALVFVVMPPVFMGNRLMMNTDPRTYISQIVGIVGYIFSVVAQLVTLIIFKNLDAFVYGLLISGTLSLVIQLWVSKRIYPYVNVLKSQRLEKEDNKAILKYAIAGLLTGCRNLVVHATDNTLIALFYNLKTVAIYTNYQVLVLIAQNIISSLLTSVNATFANIANSEKDVQRIIRSFKILQFSQTFLIALFLGGMNICLPPFMKIWMGSELTLDRTTLTLLLVVFVLNSSQSSIFNSINACGLINKTKMLSILEIILNLGLTLTFAFVLPNALHGILLGTIIANLLTTSWWGPYILYKHKFKLSIVVYFKDMFKFSIPGIISVVVSSFISQTFVGFFMSLPSLVEFLLKGVFIVVFTIGLYEVILRKKEEMQYLNRVVIDSLKFAKSKILPSNPRRVA